MKIHETAYSYNITFGKYNGYSLGKIAEHDPQYLIWIKNNPTMPENWKLLADLTLSGEPVLNPPLNTSGISAIPLQKVQISKLDSKYLSVEFEYNQLLIKAIKSSVDGAKWNSDIKCWIFPHPHIISVIEILEKFYLPEQICSDKFSKKLYNSEKNRKQELSKIRLLDDSDILIPGMKIPPYPYQKVAVDFIDRAGGRAMVADAMGLGKTVVGIAYAMYKDYKSIIICPKSVVINWYRMIDKFADKKATIWDNDGKKGRIDAQFHIVHYDAAHKYIKEFNDIKFDLMICDEATYLKNRKTKRSQSILGIGKKGGIKTKQCVFLTGTPVLNRPVEAFHLLSYLDNQRFNNFFNFVNRYGGWKMEPPKNLEELHERVKDLVIRRLKKDILKELPSKQRNTIYVEMSTTDMKNYQNHLKQLFKKWRVFGKPTVSEMPAIQHYLAEKKIPKAIEMIDELIDADRSVLIFSVYIDPLMKLKKHYGDQSAMLYGQMTSEERDESIQNLISKKAKVGLFSLGAGGMGIDGLQNSIDTVIFIDQWWTPAVHEQAEDRVHRIGQENKVQIFYLLCENTIDEYMQELLQDKLRVIETITDGKLITAGKVYKSFFKEFIKKLSANNDNNMKNINIEDADDVVELG